MLAVGEMWRRWRSNTRDDVRREQGETDIGGLKDTVHGGAKVVDIRSRGLRDVSGTEEVGWVFDEDRAARARNVVTTVVDGLHDSYVQMARGISTSGNRS